MGKIWILAYSNQVVLYFSAVTFAEAALYAGLVVDKFGDIFNRALLRSAFIANTQNKNQRAKKPQQLMLDFRNTRPILRQKSEQARLHARVGVICYASYNQISSVYYARVSKAHTHDMMTGLHILGRVGSSLG